MAVVTTSTNSGLPKLDSGMEVAIAAATAMFHAVPSTIQGPPQQSAEPLDMDAIDRSMTMHPSFGYTLSAGTVTIDLERSKILVIRNRKLNIFQLPKGRKNIGEDLFLSSLRETYEETGVTVRPLPLRVATRSTPRESDGEPPCKKSPQVAEGVLNNEFVGALHYPDPQSDRPAIKTIFYFAAEADSTAPVAAGTQEAWEKLETHWVPVDEVPSKLRFQAEIAIVKKTLRDMKNSGYSVAQLDHWTPKVF